MHEVVAPAFASPSGHRTLLVLGGSLYQVPFIQAARQLGVRVITADNRPGNPGHVLADQYVECSTVDVQGILRLAQECGVDGILAAATDVALDAVAAAVDDLGVAGPGRVCVDTLTRKAGFRAYQHQAGLPHPCLIHDFVPISYPVIVKPNRGSGSKGIRIIDRAEDLAQARADAAAFSLDGVAVCEQFIAGSQGTVEGLVRQGWVQLMMVTDRLTAQVPHVGTLGHRTPSTLKDSIQAALRQQIEKIFGDLGYADGPFDGDFVMADGVVYLLELTPRVGGNSLIKLWAASQGFDMPKVAVLEALGVQQPAISACALPAVVRILSVSRSGQLHYDESAARALKHDPRVFSLELDCPPGSSVQAFADGRHRVGDLTITADTPAEVDALLADALARLSLSTGPA